MIKLNIKTDGLESVVEYLEELSDRITEALPKAAYKAAQVVQAAAIAKAPSDTGELRAGIIVRGPAVSGDSVTAEIVSTADHGGFVENGTGPVGAENPSPDSSPHVNPSYYSRGEYIFTRVTKTGKSIRFVTDGWVYPTKGGGFRFTRGQAPRPYMYPAAKANQDKVKQIIGDAVKKAVSG